MMTALLIQQIYPDSPGVPMLELNVERNIQYAKKHGFDYLHQIGGTSLFKDYRQGSWAKLELIHNALFQNYRWIVWLDADTLIRDFDTDLRDGCIDGIGACWHRISQGDHWNIGCLYVQNSQAVKNFMGEWIAEFPGTKNWAEQGAFNDLARKSRVVQTISDRWNATLNVSMVPDAVVLGFHGVGTPEQRLEIMKATLKQI